MSRWTCHTQVHIRSLARNTRDTDSMTGLRRWHHPLTDATTHRCARLAPSNRHRKNVILEHGEMKLSGRAGAEVRARIG